MSQQNPTTTVTATINDSEIDATVPSRYLLSDLLRRELDITSVKRGCETGKCGACTVLMDGDPVKSCSVLAAQADGTGIETIEGLDDELGEIIKNAYSRNHGLQCGFCTSGFLLSTKSLLEDVSDPSRDEIRERLQGNICRCTGYTRIIEAVEDAAVRYDPE
ncbi:MULTISPECIES: (2Fe-2S)-binding protein [Natrialba]|uniref:(2Fe-2S)-binding protein n=1 Tax=Natrialba swarupiae TaxID=2448032 RepID=A0A5D5AL96_9EURY|nr:MULTISPECIES: (2Fe-2S)-binding protein [Natrialba]MCW8173482.1 (2Fe-2S)-binding protein [Natrialba swarupiae]MWV38509.1 2Fe-2S iron-sulfur cluster binding domain-containing protein [Natrialba sp. INN-245]TYT62648.1 (2Fe-2S)-binding protein [Natrialba swarupiae]